MCLLIPKYRLTKRFLAVCSKRREHRRDFEFSCFFRHRRLGRATAEVTRGEMKPLPFFARGRVSIVVESLSARF
jgi:hypothetical protein